VKELEFSWDSISELVFSEEEYSIPGLSKVPHSLLYLYSLYFAFMLSCSA